MPAQRLRVRTLPAAAVRRKVAAALRASGMPLAPADRAGLEAAPRGLFVKATSSLSEFGALSDSGGEWIWLERAPGAEAAAGAVGQLVLNLPPGRYLVDTLDVGRRTWVARESAGGGPLVAGLPAAGDRLLLRVKRICGNQPTPTGGD